jgi:hypothetical protein
MTPLARHSVTPPCVCPLATTRLATCESPGVTLVRAGRKRDRGGEGGKREGEGD